MDGGCLWIDYKSKRQVYRGESSLKWFCYTGKKYGNSIIKQLYEVEWIVWRKRGKTVVLWSGGDCQKQINETFKEKRENIKWYMLMVKASVWLARMKRYGVDVCVK